MPKAKQKDEMITCIACYGTGLMGMSNELPCVKCRGTGRTKDPALRPPEPPRKNKVSYCGGKLLDLPGVKKNALGEPFANGPRVPCLRIQGRFGQDVLIPCRTKRHVKRLLEAFRESVNNEDDPEIKTEVSFERV